MASLLPCTSVLGLRKAKHLLRRASFSYSKMSLEAFARLTPEEALSILIADNEPNAWQEPYDPYPTEAPDGYWTSSSLLSSTFTGQGRKRIIVSGWWWYNAMQQITLKHKLTFFLHTSFTVSKDSGTGSATQFYDHLRLLEKFAFGNLKTLAHKITVDNAMLDYLDNTDNNATNPNENYAREFLELFTILKGPQIAEGNYTYYTEIDIQQAAKVLSGFKVVRDRSNIDPDTNLPAGKIQLNKHDIKDKTFSVAFNNTVIKGRNTEAGALEELADFVHMVFEQEATAISYIRKLYRFFIRREWNDEIENDIIKPLATELKSNGYNMLPIVTKLLKSQHFYDLDDTDATDETIGSMIKSPLQLISETTAFFKLPIPNPNTDILNFYLYFKFIHNSFLNSAGLTLFSPDSVAGYPAHYQEPDFDRHWFSSNTVIARYSLMESLVSGRDKIISNSKIGTSLDVLAFVQNNLKEPSDPYGLITELADFLYPEAIDQDRVIYFSGALLDDFEPYYWTESWNTYLATQNSQVVKNRLQTLITNMINAPEFQIM